MASVDAYTEGQIDHLRTKICIYLHRRYTQMGNVGHMVLPLLNQVQTSELEKVYFILDRWESSYWNEEHSYEQRKFKVIAYTDTLHVGWPVCNHPRKLGPTFLEHKRITFKNVCHSILTT